MQLTPEIRQAIQTINLADRDVFTIFRDFEGFLEILQSQPVPLSKNKSQPPVQWAQMVDAQFAHPSVVELNETEAQSRAL